MVDANILIAGSAWPRWPHEVSRHALAGDFRLVLCPLIIESARHRIRQTFPGHLGRFEEFLAVCDFEEIPNPPEEQVRRNQDLVRSPADVPIALAAINAGASYLVSEDKHLTDRDETTARLRQRIQPLISGTFLREEMGWSSEDLERVRGRNWADVASEGQW
jgi:predicted nucleic acid-binding protein